MKKTLKLLTLILFAALASCAQSEKNTETHAIALEEFTPEETSANTLAEAKQGSDNKEEDDTTVERMIVKEGNIRFETSNAKQTREEILNSIKQFNGYLSHETSFNYGYKTEYTIEIRVPAKNFETSSGSMPE